MEKATAPSSAATRSRVGLALVALAVGAAAGCAAKALDGGGNATFGLTLSPGVLVERVDYRISGNGITPITGVIDVVSATRATALVSGLPAGGGYVVEMTAASTDAKTSCAATAPFAIIARQTALVELILQCKGPGVGPVGTLAIRGVLDQCPTIMGFAAASLEATVGESIAIAVTATDLDGDLISYAWSESSPGHGSIGSSSSAMTTYTCTSAGTVSLSIAVSDGVCGDARQAAIPVTCVPAGGGGTGGISGTGGGAGTGGAAGVSQPPQLVPSCLSNLFAACPTTEACVSAPAPGGASLERCFPTGTRVSTPEPRNWCNSNRLSDSIPVFKPNGELCFTLMQLNTVQYGCETSLYEWYDPAGQFVARASWNYFLPTGGSLAITCGGESVAVRCGASAPESCDRFLGTGPFTCPPGACPN